MHCCWLASSTCAFCLVFWIFYTTYLSGQVLVGPFNFHPNRGLCCQQSLYTYKWIDENIRFSIWPLVRGLCYIDNRHTWMTTILHLFNNTNISIASIIIKGQEKEKSLQIICLYFEISGPCKLIFRLINNVVNI